MAQDRTAFGSGEYPDEGVLAVMARLSFITAAAAIMLAVFLPPWLVPDFVRSQHLQHFAAFYVLMLAALAALPRNPLRGLTVCMVAFATVLEATHLLHQSEVRPLVRNWVADLGGVTAAIAPVVVERFRRRFARRR